MDESDDVCSLDGPSADPPFSEPKYLCEAFEDANSHDESSTYEDSSNGTFIDPTLDLPSPDQIEARKATIARLVIWQWPPKRMSYLDFWMRDYRTYAYYNFGLLAGIAIYERLDAEIQEDYESQGMADRVRCRKETDDYNASMPLTSLPSFDGIPAPRIREGTWLEINGIQPERTSATRALLWNRYRRDYQEARTNDTTELPGSSCRLISLPPEIKNHIYRLLLAQADPIVHCRKPRAAMAYPHPLDLRILAVSRKVHQEALAVFFEANMLKLLCSNLGTSGFPYYRRSIAGIDTAFLLRSRLRFLYIVFVETIKEEWPYAGDNARILCKELLTWPNLKEIRVGFDFADGTPYFSDRENAKCFYKLMLSCLEPLKGAGNFRYLR